MFKEIDNYPNYIIYDNGVIVNQTTDRVLQQTNYGPGYKRVGLYKNGKSQQYLVHRLVAQAFIPNPNNYPVVHHKDGDPSNNDVSNLEWCTQKENTQQDNCARKGPRLKDIPPKIEKPLIGQYDKDMNLIASFRTIKEAAESIHAKQGYAGICNCLHHKPHYNTAYGYIWEYIYKN